MRRSRVAWFACLWLLACEHTLDRGDQSSPIGVLTGRVRLASGNRLPEYASIDLAEPTLHPSTARALPSECAAANAAARKPVELGEERGLGSVLVAASDFTHYRTQKRKLRSVAIEHCRLRPSMIDATIGDILELANRDAFGFEPLLGPSFRARTLESGRSVRLPLVPGRFDAIACTREAPCGRADVAVFFHPLHAVTDARGEFRIDQFPANELVRVSAWHPLFEVSESFVWLEPGQHVAIELELTPKLRFVPPSATAEGTR